MNESRESTGNMILQARYPVGELEHTRPSRIAIVGHGGEGARIAAAMMTALRERGLDDVVIVDSIPQERMRDVVTIQRDRLLDDLRFGLDIEPSQPGYYPEKKQPKVRAVKSVEERTQSDLDALERARLKRERKAAKLRGSK